ncbi:MAG: hypothetical protein P4L84_25755 [Isosphaeraceae bacterium]|nr:hypothetical protein [Isosphaeraceae bacterium]
MTTLNRLSVLAAGLALGLAAPVVKADPIVQSLHPTNLSAATFNSDFQPISGSPAQMSPVQFQGSAASGVMESQVFQGTGAEQGLYAYAYQIAVNSNGLTSTGDPAHIDSASFHFNATPVGTDLTGSGTNSLSYVVTDGQLGGLTLPTQTGPGGAFQVPTELSWQAQANSGVLRAQFENAATGAPTLTAGSNSATFVVISTQPPTQQFVNLQSADPQTNLPSVYAPTPGTIQVIPIPEPTTILAWAGMAGAVALVRRVRKHRAVMA